MHDIADSLINLDPANFWLLTFPAFCKGLPGLEALDSRRALDVAYFAAVSSKQRFADVAGTAVPVDALAELHCLNVFNSRAISPRGGALLIELYLAKLLDTAGRPPGVPGANAVRYADAQDIWLAFRDEGVDRQRAVIVTNRDYQTRLRNLSAWDEASFSFKHLNDLFWVHLHGKDGQLVIGGVQVRRDFMRLTSRTGKPVRQKGEFSWKDSTGAVRVLTMDGYRTDDEARPEN